VSGNIRTRVALVRSFRAACTASTAGDTMLANPINVAGMLLHMHLSASAALEALRLMPPGDGWSTVAKYLQELADEETADTQRPRAATG
jgi:hypothetical protein